MASTDPGFIPLWRVAETVLDDMEQAVRSGGQVTDEQLASLSVLFGKTFDKAVELVESSSVKCLIGRNSGRKVFLVQGKGAKDVYVVFPRHYCACEAFHFVVVSRGESLQCKHQLAARLAYILRKCGVETVEEEALTGALLRDQLGLGQ